MRSNYDVLMVTVNGIERDSRVLRTAASVADMGLSVLVIGMARPDGAGRMKRLAYPTFDAVLLPTPEMRLFEPGSVGHAISHVAMVRQHAVDVLDACRYFTPRVIHTHDMLALSVGAALDEHFESRGRPAWWIHDLHEWVEGLTILHPRIQAAYLEDEQRLIRGPDALTAVSPALADVIAASYDLPMKPTVVMSTPFEHDFDPAYAPTIREVIGLDEHAPLGVYCGAAKQARGLHDLIEVMPAVPDVHFAIVTGDRGAYMEELQRAAADIGAGHRLHVLPYVPTREVASFLRTATFGYITAT